MVEAPQQLKEALADRYRVEPEIGRGGMATVYRAYDLKHERPVALKVLHADFSSSLFAERFLGEIKTTARLQHPHILPLYDSGTAAGQLFYVMPLVDGITLRDRIHQERQMKVDEATRLALEVADALSYAHGQGVVHRDIKPENIIIAGNHALVLDFGIARAATMAGADRLTQIGTAIGTPTYMSPEQAFAEEDIDGRSDIYSLGCVLYEMLAGEPPFSGETPRETMAKRMMQTAPSVAAKRSSVPYRIDAVIRTAMAREREDRYQTAARFADALGGARSGSHDGEEQRKSIAVLPFVNMSSDPDTEFFSDGITEEILNALVRLPGLRVIARTSSFAFKGKNVDVREVAEQLGAAMVLEGSVRKSGSRLRITAQLIDAGGGHHLWSERYDREMKDVFDVQDEITAAIRDALSATLLGIGPASAQAKPPIDSETYELFLRGRFFMAKRPVGMQKGMELLGEVVQRAPAYAPAYAELASAYMIVTLFGAMPPRMAGPKIRELAEAALALDPSLARAHAELGNVTFWFDWNWPAARKHYERAVALDPHDPWVNALLGHYLSSIGRHDEAIAQCERAKSLDPLNPAVSVSLAVAHFLARRYEEALAVCDRTLEQDPTFSEAYRMKGAALRELKRFDEAVAPTEAAALYSGSHPWAVALGGMLHAAAGRVEAARAVARELITRQQTSMAPPFVPPLAIALVFAQLNDRDAEFEWMERAMEARDGWLVMTRADPSFDPVRDDPRLADIIRRIGIPEWIDVPVSTSDLSLTGIHA
jgi:serine/threonine protein kinase/tetratricopeptide (TPR) repeat protein